MVDLKLKQRETRFRNVEIDLLSVFYSGGTGKANRKFRFAKVDSKFVDFLPYLNDGAVKLYLYYVVAANNESGESWHSIETISKKLRVTERSVGNWNNQLENLNLIYRTNNGKKSKATYILPLTSFAVRMSIQRIEQIFTDLNLCGLDEHTKVFGRVQSVTKLYIKSEAPDTFTELLCVHLKRETTIDGVTLNIVDTFIYDISTTAPNKNTAEKLAEYEGETKVAIINGEPEVQFAKEAGQPFKCFYINEVLKIDDATVYDIMCQLTDNVDFSDISKISI